MEPTAAIVDSQSVKTTEMGGERGYDAGKKVEEGKGTSFIDVLGLLLYVLVTGANVQDRDGGRRVLETASTMYPLLTQVWADGAYQGEFVEHASNQLGINVDIVKRPQDASGFSVLPKRWIVERTLGWLNWDRRLSKDYKRRSATRSRLSISRCATLWFEGSQRKTSRKHPHALRAGPRKNGHGGRRAALGARARRLTLAGP